MLQELRIVVLEEFRFMRDQIASVVRSVPDFTLIFQTANIEEALIRLPGQKVQIILLDMDMPSVKDRAIISDILKIDPSTSIICTGQRWDETQARLALQAGAKGFLVKPFTAEELMRVIKSFDGSPLLPVSETVTIISPKGNSGKTTLAVNLAVGLQQVTGHKIGLMDADLQFGDIPVFLNIDPINTIVEANRDLVNLSPLTMGSYLTPYNTNIMVLAAARNPALAELVTQKGQLAVLKYLRSLFRYVIVDTMAGFSENTIALAISSDIVYLTVSINSEFDLDHLKQSVELLRFLNFPREKVKIVLSRIKTRGNMDAFYQLREELFYPITALLPNQFQIATNSINSGIPMLIEKPNADLSLGILGIAKDIAENAKRRAKSE